MKINVGLLGLGNMGLLHMYTCKHMYDVNIIAVADSSKSNLKKAESLKIKNFYTDYKELIDKSEDLDAVVISLPNYLHYDSINKCIEKNFSIFVEKPLANTVDECKLINKKIDKYNVKLMIGYSMRFIEAIEKMKAEVDRGRIGSIELITCESIQNGPLSHGRVPKPVSEWWFDPKKSGGGVLIDLGAHLIDLFRFFAGDASVMFSCLDYKYNLPVEDGATLVLQSNKDNVRGIVNVGWFEKTIFPKLNFRFILHGNADFLSTESLIPKNLYIHAFKISINNFARRVMGKNIHPLSYTYYYDSYYKELRSFFNCIKNDEKPSISAIDGLKTMEIVEEAYKKCYSGGDLFGR